jgi:UDP-glucuronate decarboxylase
LGGLSIVDQLKPCAAIRAGASQELLAMHLETRVIVTGGAGFLGSHLCERLLKNGANLICVDNFFTGTRRNIDRIIDHHRFDLVRHDVTFPLYIEADQIYNLACPASPIHYQLGANT